MISTTATTGKGRKSAENGELSAPRTKRAFKPKPPVDINFGVIRPGTSYSQQKFMEICGIVMNTYIKWRAAGLPAREASDNQLWISGDEFHQWLLNQPVRAMTPRMKRVAELSAKALAEETAPQTPAGNERSAVAK